MSNISTIPSDYAIVSPVVVGETYNFNYVFTNTNTVSVEIVGIDITPSEEYSIPTLSSLVGTVVYVGQQIDIPIVYVPLTTTMSTFSLNIIKNEVGLSNSRAKLIKGVSELYECPLFIVTIGQGGKKTFNLQFSDNLPSGITSITTTIPDADTGLPVTFLPPNVTVTSSGLDTANALIELTLTEYAQSFDSYSGLDTLPYTISVAFEDGGVLTINQPVQLIADTIALVDNYSLLGDATSNPMVSLRGSAKRSFLLGEHIDGATCYGAELKEGFFHAYPVDSGAGFNLNYEPIFSYTPIPQNLTGYTFELEFIIKVGAVFEFLQSHNLQFSPNTTNAFWHFLNDTEGRPFATYWNTTAPSSFANPAGDSYPWYIIRLKIEVISPTLTRVTINDTFVVNIPNINNLANLNMYIGDNDVAIRQIALYKGAKPVEMLPYLEPTSVSYVPSGIIVGKWVTDGGGGFTEIINPHFLDDFMNPTVHPYGVIDGYTRRLQNLYIANRNALTYSTATGWLSQMRGTNPDNNYMSATYSIELQTALQQILVGATKRLMVTLLCRVSTQNYEESINFNAIGSQPVINVNGKWYTGPGVFDDKTGLVWGRTQDGKDFNAGIPLVNEGDNHMTLTIKIVYLYIDGYGVLAYIYINGVLFLKDAGVSTPEMPSFISYMPYIAGEKMYFKYFCMYGEGYTGLGYVPEVEGELVKAFLSGNDLMGTFYHASGNTTSLVKANFI